MSIVVEDVRLALADRPVLQGLSFQASPGVPVALVGPNGAGKTTTMRVLATLLRPQGGRVEVGGVDALAKPVEVRRRIGLLTEEPGLFNPLTPREHLRFVAESHGIRGRTLGARLDAVAELLGLGPWMDRRAAELSKGTRQKVALAMALVHEPPVLLLDEPTANLDVVAQEAVERLLADTVFAGPRTVLVSTHHLDLARRVCRRVVGIYEGRVFLDRPVDSFGPAGDGLRTAFLQALAAASARTVA